MHLLSPMRPPSVLSLVWSVGCVPRCRRSMLPEYTRQGCCKAGSLREAGQLHAPAPGMLSEAMCSCGGPASCCTISSPPRSPISRQGNSRKAGWATLTSACTWYWQMAKSLRDTCAQSCDCWHDMYCCSHNPHTQRTHHSLHMHTGCIRGQPGCCASSDPPHWQAQEHSQGCIGDPRGLLAQGQGRHSLHAAQAAAAAGERGLDCTLLTAGALAHQEAVLQGMHVRQWSAQPIGVNVGTPDRVILVHDEPAGLLRAAPAPWRIQNGLAGITPQSHLLQ